MPMRSHDTNPFPHAAHAGGGLFLSNCTGLIESTEFVSNTAGGGTGGAMNLINSFMLLRAIHVHNGGASSGGSIALTGGYLWAEGCMLSNNSAADRGGALLTGEKSNFTIERSVNTRALSA